MKELKQQQKNGVRIKARNRNLFGSQEIIYSRNGIPVAGFTSALAVTKNALSYRFLLGFEEKCALRQIN